MTSNSVRSKPLQFTIKAFLVLIAVVAVGLGTVRYITIRQHRSEAALRALGEFARKRGGNLTRDLVDGQAYLELRNARLTAEEMEMLPRLWSQCLSSDLGGQCEFHLDFTDARLDPDLLVQSLGEQVVGLRIGNLPVDDDVVQRIVQRSPRIHSLKLDGTAVTDACFEYIRRLPLRSLSVVNTRVSIHGIAKLRDCTHLYELYISNTAISADEAETVRLVLSGCEVYQ